MSAEWVYINDTPTQKGKITAYVDGDDLDMHLSYPLQNLVGAADAYLYVKVNPDDADEDARVIKHIQPNPPASPGVDVITTTEGSGGLTPIDEIKTVTITGGPTSGTFTLTLSSDTTASIPFDASAFQLQGLLEALASIGVGNVQVTKTQNVYTLHFMGSLAGTNITSMTAVTSLVTADPGLITDAGDSSGVVKLVMHLYSFETIKLPARLSFHYFVRILFVDGGHWTPEIGTIKADADA